MQSANNSLGPFFATCRCLWLCGSEALRLWGSIAVSGLKRELVQATVNTIGQRLAWVSSTFSKRPLSLAGNRWQQLLTGRAPHVTQFPNSQSCKCQWTHDQATNYQSRKQSSGKCNRCSPPFQVLIYWSQKAHLLIHRRTLARRQWWFH